MMERSITVNDVAFTFGGITLVPVLFVWGVSGAISNVFASVCFWLVYGLAVYLVSFVIWYWIVTTTGRS